MIVGVPREIKPQEGRVGVVPDGVKALVGKGHAVLVEKGAGEGAGFGDADFREAGAEVVASHSEVYERADLVLKVKGPLRSEYGLVRRGQALFCYLHLAAGERLTRALVESGVAAIAFETVETEDTDTGRRTRPILAPMSMIAGHLAVLKGAEYLQRPAGGPGVLVGGEVSRDDPARVLIIGAGVSGEAAARAAVGLGAAVTVVDIDEPRLAAVSKRLSAFPGASVETIVSGPGSLEGALSRADLVVGAVLRSGERAPYVVTRKMLRVMKKGSVMVDIAIDQGGCFETSHPTTHAGPVFEVDGILHYCVANMPGSVPVTATRELAKATLPYAVEIADKGWRKALRDNEALARGLNVCEGKVTLGPVAELFGMTYVPTRDVLGGAA